MRALLCGLALLTACNFPRPSAEDGGTTDARFCEPDQALRCEANDLVRCNARGTAEERQLCSAGCNTASVHCNEVAPSNGLATYLDMAASEVDVDLGMVAMIDTDDGTVTVDGSPSVVRNVTVDQIAAPSIRVFMVHSLVATAVRVTGSQALAITSDGEIRIKGTFSVSAQNGAGGPGRLNDTGCRGKDAVLDGIASGAGGGGYGLGGGTGGTATNASFTRAGGAAGAVTGNANIVPLRGGCDGGLYDTISGGGGGAIQLVSRTQITLIGAVASNGNSFGSGGSGGGILIEAPVVDISGTVVANGGAGSGGCFAPKLGEDGRLDDKPAAPGLACSAGLTSDGGRGGARTAPAGNGVNISATNNSNLFAGHGGGGVGRIRINTVSGGLHTTGVFSPSPTTGTLATR